MNEEMKLPLKQGSRVRIIWESACDFGRVGEAYDVPDDHDEAKVQLDGESAGRWWPKKYLEVFPCIIVTTSSRVCPNGTRSCESLACWAAHRPIPDPFTPKVNGWGLSVITSGDTVKTVFSVGNQHFTIMDGTADAENRGLERCTFFEQQFRLALEKRDAIVAKQNPSKASDPICECGQPARVCGLCTDNPRGETPAWRTGRKLTRTIYFHDRCIGMVDTPGVAILLVTAANERDQRRANEAMPKSNAMSDAALRADAEAQVEALEEKLKTARERIFKLEGALDELSFIKSYLGHRDQDANHAWMVRRIDAVLAGKDPSTAAPATDADDRTTVGKRYGECALRIWKMFEKDPLPDGHKAHFYIERLEALLDLGLIGPKTKESPEEYRVRRDREVIEAFSEMLSRPRQSGNAHGDQITTESGVCPHCRGPAEYPQEGRAHIVWAPAHFTCLPRERARGHGFLIT